MATYDVSTVASQIQPPQPTSLGDMLNIARGAQAYQQAQQVNPIAVQQAQTQLEASRTALAEKKENLADQALTALSLDRDILEGKDPEKITKKIVQQRDLAIRKGASFSEAERTAAHLINIAHENPAAVIDQLGNIRRSMMTAPEVQAGLSGQQIVGGTDISGNPTQYVRDPNTGAIVQAPLPAAGGQQMRIAPGETTETLQGFQTERGLAKQAATAAQPALTNIQTVRKFLPLAQTGKYSEAIAGMQSVLGNLAGDTAEEKAASARDIIQKNIADLASQKNAALGGKFAADLNAAQESIASAGKNPTAILKSMQQLEPLVQHSLNYQQGLEKVINKYGIQKKRQFDNEMIDAFDPQAMMVYNAYKSGDTAEFKELTKGMSETKKREIASKMQRYNSLANGEL